MSNSPPPPHLVVVVAVARHNFKWVEILIVLRVIDGVLLLKKYAWVTSRDSKIEIIGEQLIYSRGGKYFAYWKYQCRICDRAFESAFAYLVV